MCEDCCSVGLKREGRERIHSESCYLVTSERIETLECSIAIFLCYNLSYNHK